MTIVVMVFCLPTTNEGSFKINHEVIPEKGITARNATTRHVGCSAQVFLVRIVNRVSTGQKIRE
jgi:hypothetical protein